MKKQIIAAILFIILSNGCIKPTDPDQTDPGDGGYKIIGRLQTQGYAQSLVVNGAMAYISQGEGGLTIIDVSHPAAPRQLSILNETARGYSKKIAMTQNTVYLASGSYGVSVVDVSDPTAPFVTESNLSMKPAKDVFVYKNFLLTGVSEMGVKIAEISAPSYPDIRGRIKTPGFAHGMDATADGKVLLVACGEMGLGLFDVSVLETGYEDILMTAWVDLPGYSEDVCVAPDAPLAYLASGDAGLQVVDFSDMLDVRVIGSRGAGGYATEITAKGDRVYLATEKRGLRIFSVENPAEPELIGVIDTRMALGLDIDGAFVYIADESEGLIIVSIPEGE